MNQEKMVIGIGEALWDVLPEGKKIGGAPANFAYHVSQLGLSSCVVSAVGEDALGSEILANLGAKGLCTHIATVPYPTGTVQVEIDQVGVPQYVIREGVAWDNIPFTADLKSLAQRTTAVCFGSLAQRSCVSRATINRFIDEMPKEKDTLIVFDVNLRQGFFTKDILDQSMKKCNVLKINDEELIVISRLLGYPGTDLRSTCRALLQQYDLKILILTSGVNGSHIFTPGDISYQATPEVEVVDTIGAGDSFTAAFVSSIIKGKSVSEAHRRAVEVSAYVCTQAGAMPTLPAKFTT